MAVERGVSDPMISDPATETARLSATPEAAGAAKLPVSAIIICKNEADCIGKCLNSLEGFYEIVVVDSGSTDATTTIVEDFTRRGWPIRLIQRDWPGYAKQKQFALEQATQAWIFSIDADEWLDGALRAALPRLLAADPGVAGWSVRRLLTLYGQKKPPSAWTRPETILRLVRRGRARFDDTALVHEGLIPDGPIAKAETGVLRHERALPFRTQILKEIRYAELKAAQRTAAGKKPAPIKILFSPPIYFIRILFFNRLFLCGWPGVVHAATGALYSLMTEIMHYQMAQGADRNPEL
jgi:glycosyltransferase involved in cell wall biosynthesis